MSAEQQARLTVAVAGASGFIGKALIRSLSSEAAVIGLTRSQDQDPRPEDPVTWRQTDLFSLLQTERGLAGAQVGVYLVHSMLPTSRLTQGSFADIDFILADNFARAARRQGVRRIVYLGGLIPRNLGEGEKLSAHLESRLEVERVLASYGADVVVLRASLVIGANSSSFMILERLVKRLPFMVCPKWTQTASQPIALADAVQLLKGAILDQELPPRAYDIGGPSVLSYVSMMNGTAKAMGLKRSFVTTRLFTPSLSRLWVSTITGASKALVYPLIESLKHPMVAHDKILRERYNVAGVPFLEAVRVALIPEREKSVPAVSQVTPLTSAHPNTVCSIQRLPLPEGKTVAWASAEYTRWLPQFLAPFFQIDVDAQGSMAFYLRPFGIAKFAVLALELTFSPERSDQTRSLFYITSGALSDNRSGALPGRFEFRLVPGGSEVVAAILNYRPRLPWALYLLTQARVHLFVMACFRIHLRLLSRNLARRQARLIGS